MPLSWNEIITRAVAFSRDWADETRPVETLRKPAR